MKKIFALIISFFSLFICTGMLFDTAAAEILLDDELQRAYDSGLLPKAWLNNLNEVVMFSEYSDILRDAVALWDNEKVDPWEDIISLSSKADEPMDVEDGTLMLSYLWIFMGQTEPVYFVENEWSNASQEERDQQISKLSWYYPYFPDWDVQVYQWCKSNYVWGGLQTFPLVQSPVSNEFMLPYHSSEGMANLQNPLTRDNAIRMLVRMLDYCRVELAAGYAHYVSVFDVGTYDKNTITDDLLINAKGMPAVTQSHLPSEWHGAGISARKGMAEQYLHYSESDVRFLSEIGFNFTRLFLSFETFGYPNYPDDVRLINESELLELDQLLAWCLKYKIHLQISMNGYLIENGWSLDNMPQTERDWAIVKDYWSMLAKRYAGISSDYLTFDLCNEIEPSNGENISEYKKGLASVIAGIREADKDRVMLYSQASNPNIEWTEAIASLGIAIGCHPYKPHFITAADRPYMEINPYARPIWPQPYFPISEVMQGRSRVTMTGDIDDSELTIHVWNSGSNPIVVVYADGREIDRFKMNGVLEDDGQYYYGDQAYRTQIPAGTSEIQLEVIDDWARLDTIIIEKNNIQTVMVPSDTIDIPDFTKPLPLVIHGDGSYSNSENIIYDEDMIYEIAVKPSRDIADRYGVGFMCNEFGMYGSGVNWNIDIVIDFHETYLRMMSKYNLGWCYCELFNILPKHLIILYGNQSQWEGANVAEVNYTYEDGRENTLNICVELTDLFKQYIMN